MRAKRILPPIINVKKYGGKQVALFEGRIMASGRTTRAVLERAKKQVPARHHREIWIFAVPKSLTFIYLEFS